VCSSDLSWSARAENTVCSSFVACAAHSVGRSITNFRIAWCHTSVMNRPAWSKSCQNRQLYRRLQQTIPPCSAGRIGSTNRPFTCSEPYDRSLLAFIRTLRRSRPSLRRLHIMKSDTTSGTPPAGWRELSAQSSIQICGYIPVLHSCPAKPAVDSSRSLPSEVQNPMKDQQKAEAIATERLQL